MLFVAGSAEVAEAERSTNDGVGWAISNGLGDAELGYAGDVAAESEAGYEAVRG
jgi:hypothetical protein